MRRQSAELQAVSSRLQADYADRFFAAGATGFDAWAHEAMVGVEAMFGKGIGPTWVASVRYAWRPGWMGLFGPLVPFRTVEGAERELREELERYLVKLKSGHQPKLFRR
jgi:hypothetical protein